MPDASDDRIAIPPASIPTMGVNAKLNRGREHLEAFIIEGKEFANSGAITIEPASNELLTEFEFRARISPPPDLLRWALLIGDAINNMRSALDHAVYAAAVLASGQDPPPKAPHLQFPIVDTEKQFKDEARRRLQGLPAGAVDAIAQAQPFNNDGRLGRLRALSNTDKHRLLHLVAGMPEEATVDIRQAGNLTDAAINRGEPIHDGTLLARFVFDEPCAPRFSHHLTILYAFADEPQPRKGAARELADIWQKVVDAANALRPFMSTL